MKIRLKKSQGFTLIELMIAIAIIGILAAVVYPSYQSSIRKSRRADAKAALSELANLQEDFFVKRNGYATLFNELGNFPSFNESNEDKSLGVLALKGTDLISKDNYYRITLEPPDTARRFTLTAIARQETPQREDTECARFSINEQNEKTSTPKTDCW